MAFDTTASLNGSTLATAVASILVASLVWWRRVGRLTRLRKRVARIYGLSEALLSARSAPEILDLLEKSLPDVLGARGAVILLYNPASQSLEVAAGSAASLENAERCWNLRSAQTAPGSLSLLMSARGEPAGVVQFACAQTIRLQPDEIAALEHLANQIAIALQLLDQRQIRDRILRSEKVGAAGRLISSIASELQPTLERIEATAKQHKLDFLAADAGVALETLERLISFGRPELARVQPLDMNQMLKGLVDFRAQTWRLQMVSPRTEFSEGELNVLASRGQIEQALLSLLVNAEQALQATDSRRISVSSRTAQRRVFITISFNAPATTGEDQDSGAWGLAVARGIIENHNGEFHVHADAEGTRFEIELPLTEAKTGLQPSHGQRGPSRSLSLLLVHPDQRALRSLVIQIAARNHRAVTASTAGEAIDLASRLHFDAIAATLRLPDLSWVEFSQKASKHSPTVAALVTAADGASTGVPSLQIPAEEADLDALLTAIDRGEQ
jgi:signal transduction histidine kinase